MGRNWQMSYRASGGKKVSFPFLLLLDVAWDGNIGEGISMMNACFISFFKNDNATMNNIVECYT